MPHKASQSLTDLDDLCPMCGRANEKHSSEEQLRCSKKVIEFGIMRYCEFCGLTKPAKGMHDRCSKCDEKYPFSNH